MNEVVFNGLFSVIVVHNLQACLKLFKNIDENGKKSGVMTPIPQYPLYAATLGEYDMERVNY